MKIKIITTLTFLLMSSAAYADHCNPNDFDCMCRIKNMSIEELLKYELIHKEFDKQRCLFANFKDEDYSSITNPDLDNDNSGSDDGNDGNDNSGSDDGNDDSGSDDSNSDDRDRGHGNDHDRDDDDNPGKGKDKD